MIKTDILKLSYDDSWNFVMKRIDAMVPSMRQSEIIQPTNNVSGNLKI